MKINKLLFIIHKLVKHFMKKQLMKIKFSLLETY